jgi:hypothetical protein
MGPLIVKDMSAQDCQLEWKPPRDDGGMPVTYYVVEKCDESMGGRWTAAGETDGPITEFKVQVPIQQKVFKYWFTSTYVFVTYTFYIFVKLYHYF